MYHHRFDAPGFYIHDQLLQFFAAAVPASFVRIAVDLDFCRAFISRVGFRPIGLDFQ